MHRRLADRPLADRPLAGPAVRRMAPWATMLLALTVSAPSGVAEDPPRVSDPRLKIELFAESPQIRHPVGATCDARGRLLVIESHTHFPPEGYDGRKHDRVLRFEDRDGDGRADEVETFFEGTTHSMDLATRHDGSIYLATRNEILRLTDTNDDGRADRRQRIVFLDTPGDYPHNGLSGLQFDFAGNLFFGMGENLGERYELVGADGTKISDQAEGGNVFWCTADGNELRRVATGFWNPFGIARDAHGRLLAVDNDPQSNGCRLLHVIEGGHYGYHYRYGRSGHHPFISWRGELPGTLPMVTYTGEAPCELICYEADGLPEEYRGRFMTACWSEHRIEMFRLRPRGASFEAGREPVVVGGEDFRPVGIAVAPDGSLWISDWVKRDYKLHGQGRIWRLSLRRPERDGRADATTDRRRFLSPVRKQRDAAARRLITDGDADFLLTQATTRDVDTSIRGSALDALLSEEGELSAALLRSLTELARSDPSQEIRAQALRGLLRRGHLEEARRSFAHDASAEVRLAAVEGLCAAEDAPALVRCLSDPDPFLRSAAIRQLARHPAALAAIDESSLSNPDVRIGVLLAARRGGDPASRRSIAGYLEDPDPRVRFLALKWIADQRLDRYKQQVVAGLESPDTTADLFFAYATALARLENRSADEGQIIGRLVSRLDADDVSSNVKALILRGTPAPGELGRALDARVPLPTLERLAKEGDEQPRIEAVRYLAASGGARENELLAAIAGNSAQPAAVRLEAVVGLADSVSSHLPLLLDLARGDDQSLSEEALRAMSGVSPTPESSADLEKLRVGDRRDDLIDRVLGKPLAEGRPADDDLEGWSAFLRDGPAGDPAVGRRIFFHRGLGRCGDCHTMQGRGGRVGPDLSMVAAQSDLPALLESVLQPSHRIAPQFATWSITTTAGRTHVGALIRQSEQDHTYLDSEGKTLTIEIGDIETTETVSTSIMPTGLLKTMTDQEIRDLFAFLLTLR